MCGIIIAVAIGVVFAHFILAALGVGFWLACGIMLVAVIVIFFKFLVTAITDDLTELYHTVRGWFGRKRPPPYIPPKPMAEVWAEFLQAEADEKQQNSTTDSPEE